MPRLNQAVLPDLRDSALCFHQCCVREAEAWRREEERVCCETLRGAWMTFSPPLETKHSLFRFPSKPGDNLSLHIGCRMGCRELTNVRGPPGPEGKFAIALGIRGQLTPRPQPENAAFLSSSSDRATGGQRMVNRMISKEHVSRESQLPCNYPFFLI